MNSKSMAFKLRNFTLLIIVFAAAVSIYSYYLLYSKNAYYPTVNKGRILTSSTKIAIEDAIAKNNLNVKLKSKYAFAVIDLKGKILQSTINKYKKDEIINLNNFIEYDNKASAEVSGFVKYSTPLAINNTQVGTAIFLIPKEDFLSTKPSILTILNIIPIIISLLILTILTIYIVVCLKKDILEPLARLHESARRILKGDFSYEIRYDYESEMGMFSHDFEAMRDELKFSREKELAIKANEKELLACLSHDIKTPLTAIHGYVSGIKDGIVKDKAGIDNYCTIILNRMKMLTKLLDDILEHSKAELNKMEIVLDEFYCGDFFKDTLEDLSVETESKGLKFIYPDKIPNLLINGDRKRLSQVMYNLVSNSIKYSKEHGEICIYFEDREKYLYVYVKDTGVGIPSADVPYIFNRFYRSEKSRNQNIPGSGLGLSISKYIIESHGGVINCVQSSADGTIICFSIPI
ncbi:MAG: HAMP domain-containing sensor histidine kinase [Bacillota bacterium]|nr:HAMP domain-containing sensor histidine kinase [Bacillota bacterium]